MLITQTAIRNTLRNKKRSFFTLSTIAGGFCLLSLSIGLSFGSYDFIINAFTDNSTGHIQIHQKGYLKRPNLNKTFALNDELTSELKKNSNIFAYTPRLKGFALAYAKNKSTSASVIGIDYQLEKQVTKMISRMDPAPTELMSSYKLVYIGAALANTLNLKRGEEIILISSGLDGSIANDVFKVAGIIGNKNSAERLTIVMPFEIAKVFFVSQNQIHEIAIRLSDIGLTESTTFKLKAAIDPSLSISPWMEIEEEFYKGMKADLKGNYVTLSIILIMVTLGILNTVLMLLLERTKEFGVLKAIGTHPKVLVQLIVTEVFFLSIMGVLTGLLVAVPVNFYFQRHGIPLPEPIDMGGIKFEFMYGSISIQSIVIPAMVSILSATLVSLYPAIRAARINPVDALRSN